jgi:predicted ATP-grasp superfamily ATP-dependent carboligase
MVQKEETKKKQEVKKKSSAIPPKTKKRKLEDHQTPTIDTKKVKRENNATTTPKTEGTNNTTAAASTSTTTTTEETHVEPTTPTTPKTPKTPKEVELDYPAYCRTFKVIQECVFDKIRLREFDTMCCDGAAIIEGFPDTSGNMVSVMTANYIIKELKLPLIGDVVSKYFTPLAVVSNGLPSHGARIYGNEKIVVFVSEYDIQDPEIQSMMVDALYDFARRHRCSMIISCDGLVEDPTKEQKHTDNLQIGIAGPSAGGDDEDETEEGGEHMMLLDEPENGEEIPQSKEDLIKLLANATKSQAEYKGMLWFITNDEDFSKKMLELGHKPVRSLAIKHITGGILAESTTRGIIIACLFAPLNKHLQIGTRACISLIHCIDTLLTKITGKKMMIDTSNIEKSAKEIEKKIEDVLVKLGDNSSKTGYHTMYM